MNYYSSYLYLEVSSYFEYFYFFSFTAFLHNDSSSNRYYISVRFLREEKERTRLKYMKYDSVQQFH